ncbi:sodium/proline symporter [Lachnoclostridium sp. Marseille-P6806]|uniref:sodium/proline symporter n=1 Tax=Lachnoclostridium sp. Marseille-P6806 TaxID=2364793 RepID=UPI0010305118|nr:sodium/proline symporter [Lachnoclostridium sp. Marseille-P6806]
MTGAQIAMLTAMVCYLLVMIGVGIRLSEQNETVGDFYLGGRRLGPFVTAMSAEASDMSSWLLMGLPGVCYLSGLADAGWTAIGLAAGTYLNWLIVAKRLRRYTEANHSITIPGFFSNRYGDRHRILTLIAAVWIIVFFVPYTASGFAACGKLFSSLFGMDYHAAMILSAVIIIFYTAMGGFLAASTTDFIQSIVMSAALLSVLVFGVVQAGGIGAVAENARALPGYLSMRAGYDVLSGSAVPYSLLTICSTLAWGLGYFGMPHILLRFMAIENDSKLKLSRRVASAWVVISMAAAVLIGMTGLGMSRAGVIPVLEGAASETVIIEIADLLSSSGIFPALLAGVVLSGILASTMSTADSQLLAASSSISSDILMECFHLRIDQKRLLLISRVSLILIAVVGVFLAWDSDSSVFQIVSFAWAGFGASFGPAILLALFWRRSSGAGAMAGMLTGGVMIFIWKFLVRPLGGLWNIYELLPAFLIALAVNAVVSLLTPPPAQDLLEKYDRVAAMK